MRSMFYIALLGALVGGCAGSDTTLNVTTSVTTVPVIPSSAVSCLAKKQAGTNVPSADISAAYFRIPKITFVKKNIANDMYISLIKITMQTPGASSSYECKVGGDALSALSSDSNWWGTGTTHDTLIPANTASLTTDCPLYCGGLSSDTSFFTSATMEITGYEQAPGSDTQTPIKVQSFFNVDNTQ